MIDERCADYYRLWVGSVFGRQPDRHNLIERCVVAPLVSAPGKTEETLLVGKVPQGPQGALPCRKPRRLNRRRVDTVAEALADQHGLVIPCVYAPRKGFPKGATRRTQADGTFGIRPEIPEESYYRASLRGSAFLLGASLSGLRVQLEGDRLRVGPCASLGGLPTKSFAFRTGQLIEGCLGSKNPCCEATRGREQAVGATFLEPKLQCGVLRRSAAGDCQAIRRATKRRGFLPDLKDGVSVPKKR